MKQFHLSRRYSTMFSRISNIFIVCIMLIGFGGVLQATADTEANKALFLRYGDEILSQGNLDVIDELVTEDFVHYSAGVIDAEGPEATKAFIGMFRTAFPDMVATPEDVVAEGDKVVIRTTYTGTHQGELMGIPPTGVAVTFTGICVARVADGKLAEIRTEYDALGMMQQLGVMPPMWRGEDFTWAVPSEVTGDPGDPETNKAIMQRVEEFWNTGNLAIADEIFASDFVWHNPVIPDSVNLESYKGFIVVVLHTEFPDFHLTVEDMVAEGDKVVMRWTATGTHLGEGAFGPPTGRQVTFTGMTISRFADGKIVESWWAYDILGMMQQLTAPPEKDYSNVFFMPLTPGLNMISLPLEPQTPYTARSFAEELSATVVIKLDEARQRFAGFTLDAPDDGFAIEGGKGYIVNVPESRVVAFTGAAWTNEPPVAAPEVRDFSYPMQTDGAWAFVVSGILEAEAKDGYFITFRNTRTNAVATDVVRSGYFAAAFADLTRKNVVQAGDRLEVTVKDGAGEIASETFTYTVTSETIRQAFMPIILKNVEIPRQSLLLQNYPNPFNPETWIPYQLREPSEVEIRIYNAQGKLVRVLDLGHRNAGFYLGRVRAAYWDGLNSTGEKVASDIYFYQIKAGDFSATRKMVIVK